METEAFSFIGALAAAGCGLGIRHFTLIAGTGAGGIAGVVALCLLALVDGAASF